jgi:hypothetical protein
MKEYDIVVRPIVTEKSSLLKESAINMYLKCREMQIRLRSERQ